MNSVFITARKSMIRARPPIHTASLTRFAQVRLAYYTSCGVLRNSNGLPGLRDGGPKNSFQIRLAIRMAKEIKGSEVQCCQVVPIFLRTRWSAHNDRGNFDRLPL